MTATAMFYPLLAGFLKWLTSLHTLMCAHTSHSLSAHTKSWQSKCRNVSRCCSIGESGSFVFLCAKKKERVSKTCFCVFILVLMFSRHLLLRCPSCQSLFALGAKCRLCLAAAGSRTRWNRVRKSWSSDVSQHVQFVRHLSLIPHTCSRKECQVKFTAMGKDPMERDF